MDDIVGVWRMFRDPQTGFWCDNLYFQAHPDDPPTNPCGTENDLYSGAGTGMGLVSEAIMTELGERIQSHSGLNCQSFSVVGYQTRQEAEVRLVESLNSLLSDWPRETFRGFMVHFTNRKLEALRWERAPPQ